jgi:glycosyltransferase involved in cell wall biosynthesis
MARTGVKVAINAQIFSEKGVGGIETVLVGLVHALGQLEGPDRYVLIGPWENPDWLKPYIGSNQTVVRGPRLDFAKRAVAPIRPLLRGIKHLLLRSVGNAPTWPVVQTSNGFYESLGCNVIYFPSQHFIKCDIPAVYNPHDLQHMHYPELLTREAVIWREKTSRVGCELAHTTVAISDWVKQDIVQQYAIDPTRIQVIHWAAPTQVHNPPTDAFVESVLRKYSLDQPFGLFPAMTRPHKNHLRLLDALALLRHKQGLKLSIVCTGYQNAFFPTIEQRLRDLELTDQVRFLGLVEPDELRSLYRSSEFVVFPTLFEGAGMPVLEAWQDNAPVTCSKVTSLPELAGGAALLFDPLSAESIADAIGRMHTDTNLRDDLRRKGSRRLQDFSWERTAKQYRAVFRRAAGHELTDEDRWLLTERKEVASCESV